MLNVPPRHGKSYTVSLFVQWVYGKNIENKVIAVTYNEILAGRFSVNVRDGIDATRIDDNLVVFSDVFPEVKIKDGDAAKQIWALRGQYFSYLGTGFGGTITGVQLRLACEEIMQKQGHPEPTGRAKITPAFNLPCRYVIHTVGPIINGRVTKEDKELLASCYRSCLELAAENGLDSVAFCCISTGEFHFPNEQAAEIAVRTVKSFLHQPTSVKKVIFNVFKETDREIYARLLRGA